MADALLADLVKQLGSIAYQQALQEIQLLVGVDEEVEKLQEKLGIIQAVLDDAEERHAVKNRTEKVLLEQLKDKYYEMDDVLDTWNTARIKSKIEKDGDTAAVKKMVCPFPSPSCCFNLPLRHDVGRKIKTLNETLDNILNNREKYGIDLTRQLTIKNNVKKTTSDDVDESDITGRDEDIKNLLSNLLDMGSTQVETFPRVISLVGMGGIGKSTLAQLAYNDPEVKEHFQKRMWVCVSNPFDQITVAKAIIQEIDPKHTSLNYITEFQTLSNEIRALIEGKRFFLVLDDVWTDDPSDWEPFRNKLKYGAQGSRILVTTRNNNVAKMMGGDRPHIVNLGILSDEDCWLMLSKKAFSNEDQEQCKDLENLGKQLAHKCNGLPLAAKILGSHMRGKREEEEWVKVLQSDLWKLEKIEETLLGPLLLSYYELSLEEKKCLLYCVVFPKDHLFDRFELIIHWMAQGYIPSEVDTEMEDKAEHYFENLAMHSFFQDFDRDEKDRRIVRCKMHDIVHEFVKSMTKDVCFTINSDEKDEKDVKRASQLSLVVKKTVPNYLANVKSLRLLNLTVCSSQTVPPKLFENFTCLRSLHLKGESIMKLPKELENLIHLRYLKLSCCITELPEAICHFCNLQSLDVSECSKLKKLPQGMDKLLSLRYLLLLSNESIAFPKGIGKLTCLRTLSDFNIGGKDDKEGCKLEELKNLNQLRETLRIHGLGNLVEVGEAENVQLKMKTYLRGLELDFGYLSKCGEEEERQRMENDVLVLNALELPPSLKNLTVRFYMGSTMSPNQMMSLTTLKKLVLVNCYKLKCLPPLGKLKSLESLEIVAANNVQKVGDEFLGIEESKNKKENDIIFSNLKSLQFEDLDNWEEWMGEIREETIMPSLNFLSITGCCKLKSLPIFLPKIPSLQELQIERSPILEQRCKPRK
ncbi:putative disease resistance protein RGA3 [Quercus robur]|uniref:putative disease resistance protein RGA3 n=1 Tax=Quercus robur TaxID=38942 RepID=UPI00216302EE|nr:putative disease resistance protein RGA3 [Quercus robur]XP_050289463.1 putative disease resistance protein RGA3 [Quercus robur]